MINANRLKTGEITFVIGGKTIHKRYNNSGVRALLIEAAYPMRLEGQECYYTIRPNDKVAEKYRPVKVKAKLRYGETCSIAVANQIRLLYTPYHEYLSQRHIANLFGVRYYLVSRILNETDYTDRLK